MQYKILAYGHNLLRRKQKDINLNHPSLGKIIKNMFETMALAEGVGLAAPQVGLGYRIFIVDTHGISTSKDLEVAQYKGVFINPTLHFEHKNTHWASEGCLSIPGIRESILRNDRISISFFDEHLNKKKEFFEGFLARIIQHEYDHIEGKLFIDYLSFTKKQMLNKELKSIKEGAVKVKYPMKFIS